MIAYVFAAIVIIYILIDTCVISNILPVDIAKYLPSKCFTIEKCEKLGVENKSKSIDHICAANSLKCCIDHSSDPLCINILPMCAKIDLCKENAESATGDQLNDDANDSTAADSKHIIGQKGDFKKLRNTSSYVRSVIKSRHAHVGSHSGSWDSLG